jgi:hypothetical protein
MASVGCAAIVPFGIDTHWFHHRPVLPRAEDQRSGARNSGEERLRGVAKAPVSRTGTYQDLWRLGREPLAPAHHRDALLHHLLKSRVALVDAISQEGTRCLQAATLQRHEPENPKAKQRRAVMQEIPSRGPIACILARAIVIGARDFRTLRRSRELHQHEYEHWRLRGCAE